MNSILAKLSIPTRLWSRADVLARPCPVPARPGIYAWYFRELPGCVDATECAVHQGLTLLYIGISPKALAKNGKPPSRGTLRSRIRYHFRGNAEGSTLRLTLGCLMAAKSLGIQLRRIGSGSRMTFGASGAGHLCLDGTKCIRNLARVLRAVEGRGIRDQPTNPAS